MTDLTLLTISKSPALIEALRQQTLQRPSFDWIVLIDETDQPHAELLPQLRTTIASAAHLRLVYSDATGLYPPDISPRLLRSGFAMPGCLAVRSDTLGAALDGSEHPITPENWRQTLSLALLKVTKAAERLHIPAPLVTHSEPPGQHTQPLPSAFAYPAHPPSVSILIPTRDQLPTLQRCVENLFTQTQHIPFELILVDHCSNEADAQAFLAALPGAAPDRIRVLRAEGDFNFSTLNNIAAEHARNEFLLLLNNDTTALHPEWLEALLEEMNDPEVGIVAPRLVFPDGRIQHAGAVLGLYGAADYPWVGVAMDEPGHLGLLAYAREVSAVSGAALLIRRTLFERLNGMDEAYAIAYGDIDLCLRAAQAGYRCIWTPHATLMHEAGLTLKQVYSAQTDAATAQESFQQARNLLIKRWLPQLAHDSAYNHNLSLHSRRFEAETNPALQPFPAATSMLRRVLALPADDSGSGAYRVQRPAHCATQQGLTAARLAPGYPAPVEFERLGIQTLFSQRQVDDNHLHALGELRTLLPQLRIVMDFDDLLTDLSPHNHFHRTVWKDMPRRLHALGRLSDCLTVSTSALAEEMRAYHNDVRIVPNGIDPTLWPQPDQDQPQKHSSKLRVGWAGSISHAADLALLRSVVTELANEVEWVFFGMCLEDMRPHLTEFHRGVSFADYPRKLAELGLDLAIAPLELNRFNECKSNLRLLEYGALGIPTIATDIEPYRCGLPVTLVNNRPESWIRAIRDRLGERDTLRAEGSRLRDAVLKDWTQEQMLPAWLEAWKN